MKIKSYLILCNILLFACCCTENVLPDTSMDVEKVGISVEKMVFPEMGKTKAALDFQSGINFVWEANDTVGIFPNKGSQAYFDMSSAAGGSFAQFEGGGWALKGSGEYKYSAYFPYKFENDNLSDLKFNYLGQVQTGSDTHSHIDKYQHLASPAAVPENGQLNFQMKRMESILMFRLTMPDAKQFTQLRIKRKDGNPIVVSTAVDIRGDVPVVTPDGYVSYYDLKLDNIRTNAKNGVIVLYLMLPPQNWTGTKLLVSVNTSDGDCCKAEVDGKNMVQNEGYVYSATLKSDFGSLVEKFDGEDGSWE